MILINYSVHIKSCTCIWILIFCVIEYSTYTNLFIYMIYVKAFINDNLHLDRFETLVWSEGKKTSILKGIFTPISIRCSNLGKKLGRLKGWFFPFRRPANFPSLQRTVWKNPPIASSFCNGIEDKMKTLTRVYVFDFFKAYEDKLLKGLLVASLGCCPKCESKGMLPPLLTQEWQKIGLYKHTHCKILL